MTELEKILIALIGGGFSTYLVQSLLRVFNRKDKIEDDVNKKKDNTCDVHTKKITEMEIENAVRDEQISTIQSVLVDLKNQVAELGKDVKKILFKISGNTNVAEF